MRKLSIGMRLTLWYLVIFAMAQIVFGGGMWYVLRHHLYDLVDDNLESQVDDLKKFLEAQRKDATIAKLQEEVTETYVLEHSGDYLELYAENGELLYRSAFLQSNPVTIASAGRADRPIFWNRRIHERPFRFTLQQIEANGHVYIARMGAPTDDVVETLNLFRTSLLHSLHCCFWWRRRADTGSAEERYLR